MAIDVIVHALWRNLTDEQPSFAGLPLVGQFTDIGGQNVDYSLRPRTMASRFDTISIDGMT